MFRLIKRDVYWCKVREICLSVLQNGKIEDETMMNEAMDKIIDKLNIEIKKDELLYDKIKRVLSIAEKRIT